MTLPHPPIYEGPAFDVGEFSLAVTVKLSMLRGMWLCLAMEVAERQINSRNDQEQISNDASRRRLSLEDSRMIGLCHLLSSPIIEPARSHYPDQFAGKGKCWLSDSTATEVTIHLSQLLLVSAGEAFSKSENPAIAKLGYTVLGLSNEQVYEGK